MNKRLCPKCHGSGNQLAEYTLAERFGAWLRGYFYGDVVLKRMTKCTVCKGSGISNDS